MNEPSAQELQNALNEYAISIGTPGWENQARHALVTLREKKFTWFGEEENRLRYVINNAINGEKDFR
jgi:hypothetical protein